MSNTPRVWAPWRGAYLRGEVPKSQGCLFCISEKLCKEEKRDNLLLFADQETLVMLNRYPYTAGHLLVAPRTHVESLEILPEKLNEKLFNKVRETLGILKKVLSQDGTNIGLNLGKIAGAGIPGHLHVHLVPRWEGDVNFMSCVAETRVISEALFESYDKLLPHFSSNT